MLFVVIARFKPGVEQKRAALHEAFGHHLGQRSPRLRLGGPLKDEKGERIGVFYIAEADRREAVETLVHSSPYYTAALYNEIEISRVDVEIGSLG